MTTIKTLSIGTAQHPAQFPIRDFAAAEKIAATGGVDVLRSLPAGHYEIRSDVAFEYKHGPAASVAGYVSAPHDANVWLGVAIDKASDLVIRPGATGSVWIVPAEVF